MPIVLNGSTGVITGIPVGGLPDGIVDTDMLANNAVTSAKSTITGGKLLQTVTGTTSTIHTNNSTTFADTGLSASITPSATSSKILIMLSQTYNITVGSGSSADAGGSIRLLRDSTVIDPAVNNGGSAHKFYLYVAGTSSVQLNNCYNHNQIDSPNTTSSVTYKTQDARYNTNHQINTNPSSMASYITLIEIGA
tara:strand:+ start:38 stop:619 length:582 start_codon:yes stop_codon:yes gene_type:complete